MLANDAMSNMEDFEIKDSVLKKYKGPGGDVVIPAGVREVGENAFSDCKELRSVTIPDGVSVIGFRAFSKCRNLQDVRLPESLKTINRYAFDDCANLPKLFIPGGVTRIGCHRNR